LLDQAWSVTDLTFGFQDGHWSMAESTANTVWGSAAICSSPCAVAGAFRLISMGVLQIVDAAVTAAPRAPSGDRELYRLVGLGWSCGQRRVAGRLPGGGV
jgi:hypothetical protein